MRGLIIGLPLSALLWWGLFEYGWHTVAFLMIALALLYIATTISRDWAQIKGDEWQDGDPVNYGKDK